MKITVSELSKTYDSPVLNDISFEISTHGVLGLLGENGAGKTTLMEIIATLIRPDKGRVQYGHLRVE
ncbi:ATP-binding cassette domain-containing protein [Paenibacillus sp. UY79]|nr:ATP-binding cassette domain-containing protein [Paenibacillus farraposensis]